MLEIITLKTSRRHSAWRGAVLERAPPTVGRGVADGAEHGRVCRSVKRAGNNLQGHNVAASPSRRFDRSVSWVAGRLALVEWLPESIQQPVSEGSLGAQLAMKYLCRWRESTWKTAHG